MENEWNMKGPKTQGPLRCHWLQWRFHLSSVCRSAFSAGWAPRTLTSSTLSARTSVSSTRTTRALCSRCWSRTFMTFWSTASSVLCCSSVFGPFCSRSQQHWWNWKAWGWSTLTSSLKTLCWWTLCGSPTELKSSILALPAMYPKQYAPPIYSHDTTGENVQQRLWIVIHRVCIMNINSYSMALPLQSSRDHTGSSFLWSHRHVVSGMCHCWAVFRMASLSWCLRVWSGQLQQF